MVLKLYNTRTRQKEIFEPLDPKAVRMYVCGPTVYDFAHIGNARPVIVFDVLFRLLRHLYGADHVIYARNITDVDDKINARAAERGIPIEELTAETICQFHEDIRALGVLMPEDVNKVGAPPLFTEPRATHHIPQMQALIVKLIERGHAYEAEGHVLFEVASDPEYGALARRSVDEMRAGARVEVAPYKRDPMDFVLWKPSSGGEPGWESPWGFGRPGWHLECSAMADRWLWEEAKPLMSGAGLQHAHEFDIHGGGIDLVFPHHENEVAQSTCAFGTRIMANIWMHNGHLQVEGEKMAKSLGNFVTIYDLLHTQKFGGRRWAGKVIRFAMLSTHYRQPMDWTFDRLIIALNTLTEWTNETYGYGNAVAQIPLDSEFQGALLDDLNTPSAFARLHALWNQGALGRPALAKALDFLGLIRFGQMESLSPDFRVRSIDSNKVDDLVRLRGEARKVKNWKEADRIRDELAAMGIALKDTKNPKTGEIETTWEIAR